MKPSNTSIMLSEITLNQCSLAVTVTKHNFGYADMVSFLARQAKPGQPEKTTISKQNSQAVPLSVVEAGIEA